MLFLLSGCSSKYQLEISNDKITETIDATILKSDIPPSNKNATASNDVTPFIENPQYPFASSTIETYDKTVTETDDSYLINLNYDYTPDNYEYSKAMQLCFKKSTYLNEKNYYYIHLEGTFFCLYGNKTSIQIKTDNHVMSHNADKVNGNIYIWNINTDNINDTSIDIKIDKRNKTNYWFIYIGLIIGCFSIIIGIIYFLYQKKVNS